MTAAAKLIQSVHVDDIAREHVSAGISLRRLPKTDLVGAWLYDFEPGAEWPSVDHHRAEERYYVLSGEIIDNDEHYPAGTYVVFAPGSSHRPRTEIGASIMGISDARLRGVAESRD